MLDENIAVIDTETTWSNKLMSIGIVIANSSNFEILDKRYYIILPNKNEGGMYSSSLYINNINVDKECMRVNAMKEIKSFLEKSNIKNIFAYNALFDYGQLPELKEFNWHDIMKIAGYKQYNHKIPENADCFKTGRLKRGFGVENIYRMLSDNFFYTETHNALFDAIDELKIMKMLNLSFEIYSLSKI